MRKLTLGCLGLIVAPVLLLTAIGALAKLAPSGTATAGTATAPRLAAPALVGSWQAKGDLTTEPITLSGSSARLDVALTRQVCWKISRVADRKYVGGECLKSSGPTRLYAGPGTYYVEISSLEPWSLQITDLP